MPHKKGRWGQWNGVTTLAQWLPVLACLRRRRAGSRRRSFPGISRSSTRPASTTPASRCPRDQKLACTRHRRRRTDLGDGWQAASTSRRRASATSPSSAAPAFEESLGAGRASVKVRCLALPEHEYYAEAMVKIACEAIPAYSQWFGPYPYPQFTIVESLLRLERQRVRRPGHDRRAHLRHAAHRRATTSITSSRTRSATSGGTTSSAPTATAETWMDEGLATYFSHRLDEPEARQEQRAADVPARPGVAAEHPSRGLSATTACSACIGRGEAAPTVQEMPEVRPPRQPVRP